MRRTVILGGGYGGQAAVKHLLDGELPGDVELMLIDRLPFQGLKTEYYALAAGTLAEQHIRTPFPVDSRLKLHYGDITAIHPDKQTISLLGQDDIHYDQLIVALGCTDKFHGIPGADVFTCTLQSFTAARRSYEQINNIKPYGQVSIVGGGLSGVELAAELRESRPDLNIRVIDRSATILSTFPQKLVRYVQHWFLEHEVEMLSHISLTRIEPGMLYDVNRTIATDVTVWTAGIQPNPLVEQLGAAQDGAGRIVLNELHQIPGMPNIYVAGDCASLPCAPSGQAAEAQGKQIAEVLRAGWHGKSVRLGPLKLKGMLGSLGKKSGFGVNVMGKNSVVTGRVPRVLKSGVLWMAKHHSG